MDKKAKKKNPLKLKACAVALSLWGLYAVLALSSSPVMAAETASNTAQEQVARALFNKGVALDNLHRYEEALAAYNDFITRFENSQEMYIRDYVATALLSKSIDLEILHRHKEAIAAHDAFSSYYPVALLFNKEPFDYFQWWNGSQIGSQLAVDLLNKGKELTFLAISDNDLGNGYEEAITTYNDFITRFENSYDPKIQEDPEIQEQVAEAWLSKGEDLDHLHRYEEALAVYNKLITDFGDSHYTMAKALLNEGNDLEILHRIGQARADWEELVYRFKDNPYVIDQNAVAEARHNLAITKKEKTFLERLSSYF